MRLEAQGLTQKELAEQTDELARELETATERSMALTGSHAPGADTPHGGGSSGIEDPLRQNSRGTQRGRGRNTSFAARSGRYAPRGMRLPGMLSDTFLQRLHAAMFDEVWKWAGQYRQHDTNIGVPAHAIRVQLRHLYDEASGWLEYKSYEPERIRRSAALPRRKRASVCEWQWPDTPHAGAPGDGSTLRPAAIAMGRKSVGGRRCETARHTSMH